MLKAFSRIKNLLPVSNQLKILQIKTRFLLNSQKTLQVF